MTANLIKTLWSSGFVNRWHSNPDARLRNSQDTTAAHSQRVAVLVAKLWEHLPGRWRDGSLEDALVAALLHDAPECFVGDAPWTIKRKNARLKLELHTAEEKWLRDIGQPLTVTPVVVLCDQLDAVLFCKHVAPDLLTTQDWLDHVNYVLGFASQLEILETVEGLIYE